MSSASRLLSLPGELLVEILKLLDTKHLLRCRLICREFEATIKDSLQLRYKIELEAEGLVDGVGCPLPVAERYKLLMERRKRWRWLDWSQVAAFPTPALCQAYELVDGVFASSMSTGLGASRHLSLTRLPTASEPARTTEWQDLGAPIRDFAIDPSQDLVALVIDEDTHENKPHPNAAKTELYAPISFQVGTSFIQIVDDVIGVFFWIHGPGLIIWNWRTGRTVVQCLEFDLPTSAYDFGFLSNRAFMVTVAHGQGYIEIYTFNADLDVSVQTQSPPSTGRRPPVRIATLLLPSVKPGKNLQRFATHSGPFVGRPTPGRPFETSPDCRLHVMELGYGDHFERFSLFVRNRHLLSYIPPDLGFSETYMPVTVAWDEWGPENTRFVSIIARFQWLRYVHGERVVLPPVPGAPSSLLLTLDFNVHLKRVDDPLPLGDGDETVMSDGAPLSSNIFLEPVVSKLPFIIRARVQPPVEQEYSGYMIDQDHLVGMRVHTLITIPGASAHHILGHTDVTLGAGDLNIVPTESEGKVLLLTVGSAAFVLEKETEFGTIEDDSCAYVFKPKMDGVGGGYVKMSLPEGVKEDGSQLSELQTKFEEILVERGILQASGESSARSRIKAAIASPKVESLVSIPGAVAAQILGEETTVLSEGILSLDVIPQPAAGDATQPLLTLTVGHATFPLYKTTSDTDLAELQNTFELVLTEYGLLKDGFEAAADEVGRSIREDSARTAQRIREAKDFYLKTHPRTVDPVHVSSAARNLTGSGVSGTQSLANAAHWVSGVVTSAAASAGGWIASTFVPTEPATTEKLNSTARGVSSVVSGAADGTKEVKDTLKDAAGSVVENDYGEEAREVSGNVGQSVGNVGAVAGDVATVTSGAALAVAGLQGAAGRQDEELKSAARQEHSLAEE
ncbi:senescence-associated protein-domain-containing protein [Cubamyces lactineus]|nr:senescence-associated protein-domain-containing protein [Cubamyces lactineus]